ncbi:MAG: sulfatase-like hydrolase/transferase, partial [Bacteroidota bacterium]
MKGLLFALVVLVGSSFLVGAKDQPNIIVLLADDLGYAELGCQGNTDIPTPHIDSIAENGVRFTSAYVTGPNCSPSRAGFLTGRTPTRFGYEFNPTGAKNEYPGYGMPSKEVTLAEALHDAGYTTGIVGKWHQGGTADFHPFRHGFDEFFGFTHEGHYFVPPPYHGVTTLLRRKTLPGGGQGLWQHAAAAIGPNAVKPRQLFGRNPARVRQPFGHRG